jgi:large subunit ribosomal protein L5
MQVPSPDEDRRQHGRRRRGARQQADRRRRPRPRAITGQKPSVTKARKSIAQFKLREGMPIGAHVTLAATGCGSSSTGCSPSRCPRIRDFRGLSPKQFDGNGNYTFGLTEQSMFHEIDIDKVDRTRGWTSPWSPRRPTTTRAARCCGRSASPFKES